jgi:hypothetical protein
MTLRMEDLDDYETQMSEKYAKWIDEMQAAGADTNLREANRARLDMALAADQNKVALASIDAAERQIQASKNQAAAANAQATAAEKWSKSVARATWVLAVATTILAVATLILAFHG